jgi:hypothetical protein
LSVEKLEFKEGGATKNGGARRSSRVEYSHYNVLESIPIKIEITLLGD